MKDETKFLIEIVEQFGKDAQNVLDFVSNPEHIGHSIAALFAGLPSHDDGIDLVAP